MLIKVGKTPAEQLPMGTWREVCALRGNADQHAAVFMSRRGTVISHPTAWRIVRRAVDQTSVKLAVSRH